MLGKLNQFHTQTFTSNLRILYCFSWCSVISGTQFSKLVCFGCENVLEMGQLVFATFETIKVSNHFVH